MSAGSRVNADTAWKTLPTQDVARNQVPDHGVEEILLGINKYVLNSAQCRGPFFKRDSRRRIDAPGVHAGGNDIATVVFF